jgi:hypothetical protein
MLEFLTSLDIMGSQDELGLYTNMLAFGLGLIIHIVKQMWEEQVSLKDYLMTHKARSMLSMGSLASVFMLITATYPASPLIVYFLCGYSIDSLVNKAPLTSKKIQKENIV